MTEPIWSIRASVVTTRPYGPGGAELKRGLRLFAPGAKVYVGGGYAGLWYQFVTVVGRDRHKHRYVTVSVRTEHLTDWRVELVYSPGAIKRLDEVRADRQRTFRSSLGADPTTPEYRELLTEICDQLSGYAETRREGVA